MSNLDGRGKFPGFDPEFSDLRDYILKITWRIWEEEGIDRIYDYYAEQTPVKTPSGSSDTAEQVVQATRSMLGSFPDRKLYGEDVVGSHDAPGRFYSSHRIYSTMSHKNDSDEFGPATGKRACFRIIADCVCERNQVIDEWMVRDRASAALQFGLDLDAMARDQRERTGRTIGTEEHAARWACGIHNPTGIDPALNDMPELAVKHINSLKQLIRGKVDTIKDSHDRAASCWFPVMKTAVGDEDLAAAWYEHACALHARELRVHHAIEEQDHGRTRTAVRWSYIAQHAAGFLGSGTGRDVAVLGISQAEWRDKKIIREWHLWDVIALKEQLL